MRNIFYAINSLKYEDKPNYAYIRQQLDSILNTETQKELSLTSIKDQILISGKRKFKSFADLEGQPKAKRLMVDSHKAIFKIEKVEVMEDQFKLLVDVEYYKKLYAK